MKSKLLILLIVVLASLLRGYQLTTLPALNADEAALGYNAYSLLETGKDEHGNPWPIHFQSFNDYKPGLYVYLLLPFVKFLGLTELAVRLPGVITGALSVLVVWLLVRNLWPGKRYLPEVSAFLLTISPWHVHFSRGGWEVVVATFFLVLGVYALIKGVRNQKFIWLAAISMIAAFYTYHAARVVGPLLALSIVFLYRRELLSKKHLKTHLAIAILGVVLLFPLAKDILGPSGISRASGVGLLADPGPINKTNEQRGEHKEPSLKAVPLLHNKLVNYSISFAENYASHFSIDFLFLSGDDIQRNKTPEFGQLYLFELATVALGLTALLRNFKREDKLVLSWLAIAPIAAALTFQSPHALRAQNMIIPLTIISAWGLVNLFSLFRKSPSFLSRVLPLLFVLLIVWDVSRYLHQYYSHVSKTYDFSSQYGMKELVEYIKTDGDQYSQVVTTTRYDQPYILYLFYLKYPPEKFQREHTLTPRDQFGFSTVESFGKYTFREIKPWEETRTRYTNSLIAGSAEEVPDGANVVKVIQFPSGRAAFKVVAN